IIVSTEPPYPATYRVFCCACAPVAPARRAARAKIDRFARIGIAAPSIGTYIADVMHRLWAAHHSVKCIYILSSCLHVIRIAHDPAAPSAAPSVSSGDADAFGDASGRGAVDLPTRRQQIAAGAGV